MVSVTLLDPLFLQINGLLDIPLVGVDVVMDPTGTRKSWGKSFSQILLFIQRSKVLRESLRGN
jgi:hypothetical protein